MINNNIIFFDLPNKYNSDVYQNLKTDYKIIISRSFSEIQELITKFKPFLVIINRDHFIDYIESVYQYLKKYSPYTIYIVYSLYRNKKEKKYLIRNFADDCIFSKNPVDELISKIISFYRRTKQFLDHPRIIRVGDMEVNYTTRIISNNETSVKLSETQFRILDLLTSQKNHVFTRKEIISRAFSDYKNLSRRAVDVYVRRLRESIQKIVKDKKIILTVHGLGYKFNEQLFDK